MSHVDQFVTSLKRALKAKNIIYKDLAKEMDLSESSIKRILSDKSISLDRIEEICRITDISFAEICMMANFEDEYTGYPLTEEQEYILSLDKKLIHILTLLSDEYSTKNIEKKFEITSHELRACLLKLDKIGIIELHANDRVKLKIPSGPIRFRKNGPIGKLLLEYTKNNYLNSSFDHEDEYLRFGTLDLTKNSMEKLKKKFDKIMNELLQESKVEQELQLETKEYGLLLAYRPWSNETLEVFKRKKK